MRQKFAPLAPKRRRQFIFATHNANIPVLGDAEQIIGLSPAGEAVGDGTVKLRPEHMGSIDFKAVRELVEEVLEGGKEVRGMLKDQKIDPIREQTLSMHIDAARRSIPDAIQQAYSIVVTVSDKGDVQAFKIAPNGEPLFARIKQDKRSRIQDTAVTAEALLPDGPYNLWRKGETMRLVKHLVDAFAQFPHLPKMLNRAAIMDTIVRGCQEGAFVLRVTRPDKSVKTYWRERPDEAALKDPALEVVLPEAAEITALDHDLLAPQRLPGLWGGSEISVKHVAEYFAGGKVVKVDKGGYDEPLVIPKAGFAVIESAVQSAVKEGRLGFHQAGD